MDIIRNVGVRSSCAEDALPQPLPDFTKCYQYASLPNIVFGEYNSLNKLKSRNAETTFYYQSKTQEQHNNYAASPPCVIAVEESKEICSKKDLDKINVQLANKNSGNNGNIRQVSPSSPADEECAISGRLEIRVMSKEQLKKEPSPNPEESVYFDAVVNGDDEDAEEAEEAKEEVKIVEPPKSPKIVPRIEFDDEFIMVTKKEKKYDIKIYEDSLKITKYRIVDKSDKSENSEKIEKNVVAPALNLKKQEPVKVPESPKINTPKVQETPKIVIPKVVTPPKMVTPIKTSPPKITTPTTPTKVIRILEPSSVEDEDDDEEEEEEEESEEPIIQKIIKDLTPETSKRDKLIRSQSEQVPVIEVVEENDSVTTDNKDSSIGKVPAFNHVQSPRMSKCASWDGEDNENPDMSDLTPGKDK